MGRDTGHNISSGKIHASRTPASRFNAGLGILARWFGFRCSIV